MKHLESTDKQAILEAQVADETANDLPRLEGQWGGGGIHVVGPDPQHPRSSGRFTLQTSK
jgi:hypothetical protein